MVTFEFPIVLLYHRPPLLIRKNIPIPLTPPLSSDPPNMQFSSLFALSLLASVALAAPLSEEATKREPSVSCGGRTFSSSQVARAVDNSNSDAASSTTYPHTYK